MNKADEESKRKIDEISKKAEKEISSLGKLGTMGLVMFEWVMVANIEELAKATNLSFDALLMTFSHLLLQAAIDKSKQAEIKNLADSLTQKPLESERAQADEKANTIFDYLKKGGYIQ